VSKIKKVKLQKIFLVLVIASVCFLSQCKCNKSKPDVDVSGIAIAVKIDRFEQDFFAVSGDSIVEKTQFLQQKYGDFYLFYVQELMAGFRLNDDTATPVEQNILAFTSNNSIRGLYDSVEQKYVNIGDLETGFTDAYKHIRYYFPEVPLPKVTTMITEFGYGVITSDTNVLAIGLDMFMGDKYPYYDNFGIPEYIQRKLERQYIVPNGVTALGNLYFGADEFKPGRPLLEAMVEKGKRMYFLSRILPEVPDSILIGYTAEQLAWCKESEYAIWQFMNEKDLLYTDKYMEQKRYLMDGPTTNGMPAESPGNIGTWIGWKIVNKYMEEAGDKVSLKQLMTEIDNKTILAKANYRPKK
jgi:hypothetical protein